MSAPSVLPEREPSGCLAVLLLSLAGWAVIIAIVLVLR